MRCIWSLLAVGLQTSFLLNTIKLASTSPILNDPLRQQQPLVTVTQPEEPIKRKLHGRFLHITDVHPDPFYSRNASASKSHECHSDRGRSGYYGAERSDCDSPFTLANATFEWIRENLKDKIDFVVWTGDSARHDNDINHPRSESQIYDLNNMVVGMMVDVFKKPIPDNDDNPNNDLIIPIIPTLGNNDIMPHNIMLPGPTSTTRTYLEIWRHFIPEAQKHVFEHGAYFWVEVIPSRLAVFSLNTMYFFASNAAVDGCDSPEEPGYQQFVWLKVQLELMRLRGMKAILIGHVPPARTKNKQAWDESCWAKYVVWGWNYRDVIVGGLYGHMNLDHFMLLDTNVANKIMETPDAKQVRATQVETWEELVHVEAAGPYLSELREVLSKIPEPPEDPKKDDKKSNDVSEESNNKKGKKKKGDKDKKGKKGGKKKKGDKKKKPKNPKKQHKKYIEKIGGKYAERYVPVLVSPSVIPNYFPSLRIIEYNITGVVDDQGYVINLPPVKEETLHKKDTAAPVEPPQPPAAPPVPPGKKKPKPKPDPDAPTPPPTGSAPGPAYSPQSLSLTGITQYYANLTRLNGWVPEEDDDDEDEDGFDPPSGPNGDKDKDDEKPKKPRKPRQAPLPFEFEIEYRTANDSQGYKVKDMSVRSLVKLANRMRDLDVKAKCLDVEGTYLCDGERGYASAFNETYIHEEEEKGSKDKKKKKGKKGGKGGKGKKGKKGKGKKGRKHKDHEKKQQKKKDRLWHLFVKRAFVGAVGGRDIQKVFEGETWADEL
ncbi:hypothetical protein AOL_s00173g106 [Orbilia oligospora ATCC 24927]|uniref:Endopolyphosphatase n=1 Tax=Arthrobotrys oligospora (strain ATCC 24927 / CBS 115.81 / DSM 1491) TaxID=756982 RepID=G1XNT8_ARTOA|nr:hypothetical protein AOL_s00173g106 [Orbilia oligospora ATCC 24927]EGX45005.1 hypothetical protein AOL_s00173g106 [Orbilia oligospora ATCC 24927]